MPAGSLATPPKPARPTAGAGAPPARYVRIPQRLITTAVYHPLQIGVYGLVARLFRIAQAPVPLSAADITRYDPAISRGAAQRALAKLVYAGWLIAAERSGKKSTYGPAWGRVTGKPLPWTLGATCLGRPRHVRAVCVDLRLFDMYLGKLSLHPQRAAVITRYVTSPLLNLADVGSYAVLLAGLPGTTSNLLRWGLVRDERPLPLGDDTAILAQASQYTLFDGNGVTLTTRGLQKTGLIEPDSAPESGQTLFFVSPEVIGDWPIQLPEHMIGSQEETRSPSTAQQRHELTQVSDVVGITWDSTGATQTQMDSPPTPRRQEVGGGDTLCKQNQNEQLQKTESFEMLKEFGVISHQALQELAHLPPHTVQDILAYARQEGLGPGWVVTYLSDYRNSDVIVIPTRKTQGNVPIDWGAVARQNTSGMARLGSDVSDIAGFGVVQPLGSVADNTRRDNAGEIQPASQPHQDLVAEMKQHLRMQCERRYYGVIDALQFSFEPTRTVVRCRSEQDRQVVERLRLMLRSAARLVGVSVNVRLVINTPARTV